MINSRIAGAITVAVMTMGCAHAAARPSRGNPQPPALLSDLFRSQVPDSLFKLVDGKLPSGERVVPELDGVMEITLQRTGCYGVCPSYQVTFRQDGTAEYWGGAFAPRLGQHSARGGDSLNYLAAMARELGLFEMKPYYSRPVTDNPTTYVSIVRNGERTIIMDYAQSGPLKLIAFQVMVDQFAEKLEWIPSTPEAAR